MKDRRKRGDGRPWKAFLCFALFIVILTLLGLFFTERYQYHQQLVPTWRPPVIEAVLGTLHTPLTSPSHLLVPETVLFPDQAAVFLKYPPSTPFFTKHCIHCIYFSSNSSTIHHKLAPLSISDKYLGSQIVRCPLHPRGFTVSVAVKSVSKLPAGPVYRWDSMVYESLIDRDNTTVVFVKGLNLRSGRVANASRFECVYGLDFQRPKFFLSSEVLSIAQEIVRCKTPLSLLKQNAANNGSVKVSIRVVGRGVLRSIARPEWRIGPKPLDRKLHQMCVCTMLRNQARFLKEWIVYNSRVGVQQWFIYDNNSDDDIVDIVKLLVDDNYNISRHIWPWIKTQEAGFAHCALRARDSCEWVGFIDVDEFLHFPTGLSLHSVLNTYSRPSEVAELRTSCLSFGPSGLKRLPVKGVMAGYTCRLAVPERHKSIVRPEALNSTLINMVHHFHLRDGYKYVNMNRSVMVINHYKYQVWEVFKEKFYRRVATYVFDWQQAKNVESRDRVPGLGTQAIEPPDWSTRFCEVRDTDLREKVLQTFTDPETGMLPWQVVPDEQDKFHVRKKKRRKILRKP